ncbi:hypothetical protein LguiA_029524 [Lonicera macranthoides]
MSLITVREEDNNLRMHNQLRGLGRHIGQNENLDEPGKRSRLWRREEALDALRTHQRSRSMHSRLGYATPKAGSPMDHLDVQGMVPRAVPLPGP